jgi:hypothetical protein
VLLVLRSTQLPPQHDWPVVHERPHCPQFAALVDKLKHVPLQLLRLAPQQIPFEQLLLVHSVATSQT